VPSRDWGGGMFKGGLVGFDDEEEDATGNVGIVVRCFLNL
jgi:hypothetical protein